MTLIFATNNENKIKEMNTLLVNGLSIISLKDAGINIDIPEPHKTIEENATEKATVIYNLTNKNCFGEDTGLEVAALNGAPGVRSARYAGEDCNHKNNITLLLKNMANIVNRNARFKTVISCIINGVENQFTGICEGKIMYEQIGDMGFGYDAIFVPQGADKTFAQMNMEEKNIFSHRQKAMTKLIAYLNQL